MPQTALTVLFGSNALAMRADFTVTVNAGGEHTLAPAADLYYENSQKKYATFEPDYWVLDGSYKFIPASANVGYMSTELSDGTGDFSTEPQLQFDFGAAYSTDGLTLYFSETTEDYCDYLIISYYDAALSLIQSDPYPLNSPTLATGEAVANFKRIIVTFGSTNNPYRFARLINIDFDTLTRWTGGNIKNGTLVEQIDRLSLEIPSNEIEFTLHSTDADFSVLNPSNEYAALQENEPIEAYEEIGDLDIFLGKFYLSDWESLDENNARFVANDAIALMDKPKFYCTANGASVTGIYYYDEMIAKIMEAAGVEYEIDASLVDVPAWATYSGMLPVMSCREALQQACFALGATVTCARSRVIQIIPFELVNSSTVVDIELTSTNKGKDSPIKLRKAFTALDVLSWEYTRLYYAGPSNNLFEQADMPNGVYTIIFQTPTVPSLYDDDADMIVASDDYGRYWIKFTIDDTTPTDYAVIDAGYYFDENPKRYLIENNTVPATTPTHYITIDRALLVKEDDYPYSQTITQTIQRVVSYFLQRIEQAVKTFGLNVAAGDSVSSVSQGDTIYGTVERAEFDLTGGFRASLQIVGEVDRDPQTVTYDDNDARFTYYLFSGSDSNASDYGGGIVYSPDTSGGWVEFYFIGFQLTFIYRQFSGYGSGTVYIDDVSAGTVNQNGATDYQHEWTSSVLENTYHKVRIEKTGTSGIFNIDAVEVSYK